MRSAKVEINIVSTGEYRMECSGATCDTVRTATRTATRTAVRAAAAAAAVTALVTGGVIAGARHTADPEPGASGAPTAVVALPRSIEAANRAW